MRSLFILVMVLPAALSHAQSFEQVAVIQKKADFFTTDKLGNAYLACREGVYKYDARGREVAAFADKALGAVTSIDATDALKVLLFNREFRKAYILDDKLTVRAAFDLSRLGVEQPWLICTSRHDGYWVYDALTRRLLKFDTGLDKVGEGVLLSGKLASLDPDFMVESSDWIFMHDPAHGIIMFDRYGTYYRSLRDLVASRFQCVGEQLVYLSDRKLTKYDIRTGQVMGQPLPEMDGALQVRMEKNRIYINTPDAFYIYSF